jgi:hypothetical protein
VRPAGRTSTLGLIPGRKQSLPTASQQTALAQKAMAGHDELPESLRLFLHEWAGRFPQRMVVQIVDSLKQGYGVVITAPDGKKHKLLPDTKSR